MEVEVGAGEAGHVAVEHAEDDAVPLLGVDGAVEKRAAVELRAVEVDLYRAVLGGMGERGADRALGLVGDEGDAGAVAAGARPRPG